MGAYRGEPAELVRCETVDLEVPASAEIVIEGVITDDPTTYEIEGPFGEFTGYVSDVPTPRPAMQITCLTHRRDPIFRGTLEGTLPGSYSENSVMSSVQRAAIAWNILTQAGIPGVRDVFVPPITNGVNIVVQIAKAYQGQPKQIAAALWGNSAAQYRYKHVTVVEDDIDPSSYEQVDWAFAHRVNAGEGGIVVFPGIFGSPIDPSTPLEDRNVAQLGTGLWNRVLIDATRSWRFERRPEGGGGRVPPTPRPAPRGQGRARGRPGGLGLGDPCGKTRGVPVYQLLGGRCTSHPRVYASLLRYETPARVRQAVSAAVVLGYTAIKLHQIDVESVAAAREVAGDGIELMLDTNCPWTVEEAIRIGRALERFDLRWLEEPVWPPEDYPGLARVRAALRIPLASGENEATVVGIRAIIDAGP